MNNLSEICRRSLKHYLMGDRSQLLLDMPAFYTPKNFGLYVSLYSGEVQRGCLGVTDPVMEVEKTAVKLCLLSATMDDRFPPVKPEEVDGLEIKIWLLTEQTEVRGLKDVDFSRYGVVITHVKGQCTLLPYFTRQESEDVILDELQKKSKLNLEELKTAKVCRIQAENVGDGTFDYSKPKVLRDVAKHWPALKSWSPAYFIDKFGNLNVQVRKFENPGLGLNPSHVRMQLSDYLRYWSNVGAKVPNEILYFANWLYEIDGEFLNEDFDLPSCFRSDLINRLPKNFQYPRRWLFWGHQHCSSPAHVDTLFTSAWLAMIIGRKKIQMVSPEHNEHFAYLQDLDCSESKDYCDKRGIQIIEEVISPGDILFIPGGWLHQVASLEPNLLLTGNFLDPNCKDLFLDEISRKSGRTSEIQEIKRNLDVKIEAQRAF